EDPEKSITGFPSTCYTMIPNVLRNTSMESYMSADVLDESGDLHQTSNRSCMGCHQSGADFSFIWLDAVEQVVEITATP
ncbi:MAG: hypothetical protein ACI8RZ_007084, partial [Myxococcota bacterium]